VLITKAGANPLSVRNNGAGGLISFNSAGSAVGSIQSRSGVVSTLILDPRSNGAGLTASSNTIMPTTNTGSLGGVVDLGSSGGYAFRDLHLSGTIEIENGTGNVGVGKQALNSNTGSNNTAVGYQAGYTNTTGDLLVAVGGQSLYSNTTGERNTATGWYSLVLNTTGSYNTAFGNQALYANTTANENTALGYQAGYSNTTSSYSTFIGKAAGYSSTGAQNTYLGEQSGYYVTSGAKNTILGRYNGNQGGLDIRTSSNNIVLSDGDGTPRVTVGSTGHVDIRDGGFSIGTHTSSFNQDGTYISNNDGSFMYMERSGVGNSILYLHRRTTDGNLIEFHQGNSVEGSISVSGSTVSYNGFCGTHDSTGEDVSTNTAVGTVVSTIDEEYKPEHARIKVSDTVGDTRVYGVLQQFKPEEVSSDTEQTRPEHAVIASVGICSVLVTGACSGGDLLESNGDGTAKVQSDDIVRSKTIGKVTIGNSDTGVKLVSCVLYCG